MATATNPDVPKGGLAFIPLEANPPLLTALVHKLGISQALAFHDVFSLDDPSLLAFVPRPALALLLVFPVSAAYESHRLAEDALLDEYQGKGEAEPVVWVKQTIRNACGLMGVLHGVLNGEGRGFIGEFFLFMGGEIGSFRDVIANRIYHAQRKTLPLTLCSRSSPR